MISLRNTATAYGLVSRCLHWSVALLFIGQIALGWLTQVFSDQPVLQFDLYQLHKSVGFLILALALIRLAWSLFGRSPHAGAVASAVERLLARFAHRVLLLLTVAVPLAGWAIASASPLGVPSYVFDLVVVPNLPLPVSDAAEAFWSHIHAWLAYGAAGLVSIHAAAALFHAFRRGRTSLHGMLPQRR
ncbi:cytochrome B [Xaviernesmea oryzae]|uniref:Cytochrome B n=1 Tax=Xaviernesmea oryzae TaxID=464029 RepID=A0A1Q9AR02_9HYPH|nr:cytochrome b/b6 domain-containing protein [Xaviernesmea oryzae]OLP57852.1 cytochrome B [Xaviernesmea oryzae]SEL34093.1 cytochrome b561 [Xaviernesmea oryzae]